MTILFAGGELEAFTLTGTTAITTSTTRFDSDFSRMAFTARSTGTITADFTAQTEGWLHFAVNHVFLSSLNGGSFLELKDSGTGQTVVRIDGNSAFDFTFDYWNGASFTQLFPLITFGEDITQLVDIHWKIADSGGFFKIYVDGKLRASFEGDTLLTGFTQIDRLVFSSPSGQSISSFDVFYSEIIVATEATIGWHLATVSPDGAGNSTTWTGDNTDVDDAVVNDGTFITSTSADEVEQFTVSNLSSTAALLNVEAVVVVARSRNVVTGPQNVQLSIRTGGSDFFSSNIAGINTSFSSGTVIYEQNPDTVADWTPSEINALEIGVKSIT